MMRFMLSVIIPTLNDEASLPRTLAPLVPAVVRGVVREVIIVDGGSTDSTLGVVDAAGARLVKSHASSRGGQLAAGAGAAKAGWFFFLYPGTVLEDGWDREIETLLEQIGSGRFRRHDLAATFRLALNDFSWMARFVEKMVALRCFLLRLPYGDQGLLIQRQLYDRLGGYNDLERLDDLDLVRRIGRKRLILLRSHAKVNANAYLSGSMTARMIRNAACILLSYFRVPPRLLAWMYR